MTTFRIDHDPPHRYSPASVDAHTGPWGGHGSASLGQAQSRIQRQPSNTNGRADHHHGPVRAQRGWGLRLERDTRHARTARDHGPRFGGAYRGSRRRWDGSCRRKAPPRAARRRRCDHDISCRPETARHHPQERSLERRPARPFGRPMSTCAVPMPVVMWITAMSPDPHEVLREPALDLPDEPPCGTEWATCAAARARSCGIGPSPRSWLGGVRTIRSNPPGAS